MVSLLLQVNRINVIVRDYEVKINGTNGVYTGEVNSSNLPHGEGKFCFEEGRGGMNLLRVYDGVIFGLGKFLALSITCVYTAFVKYPSGFVGYGEFQET